MFHEDEDWNDAADVLSQIVVKQKPNSHSTDVKSKHVGKKSLLRTLQTLESIPDWKRDDQLRPDSDSEAATPDTTKKKKKKKKRRRTKQASMTTAEQENNTEVKEEKTVAKKKMEKTSGVPKSKSASAGEGEGKASPQQPAGDVPKVSRQQWKNKMKNKRKCKNKYRQNKAQEDVGKDDKTLPTTPSHINSGKPVLAPDKQTLPQKRKKTDEDVNTGTSAIKCAKKERDETVNGSSRASETLGQKVELLKRQRLRKLLRSTGPEEPVSEEPPREAVSEEAPREAVSGEAKDATGDRSSRLRLRVERRLEAARFRYINQLLYSSSSGEAKRMFQQDPQAFQIYHRGFTEQVRHWPANPVDAIIAYIHKKPSSLVVADFGCGDCKIALSVKNKVHSFDLVATCDLVTVCDMAHVPLPDRSVDIGVFCLSLMGTNLAAFLVEANRVLKKGGVLKIAEVASRFDNVRNFLTGLAKLGFKLESKDTENTHFYTFDLTKTSDAPEKVKNFGLQLKACLYKKR
ncbi:ribosomal RNA-processing protein 8 [Hippocampus comes]|uniref:Ribosomal RNA-processing protein 8 n=1 Tax=Hippocampus comes TaxID=109280 RepID=A0A3Q3D1Z0_HIPCM|nr:PREDICTED: ribosomal RNA-processing protein 8 [Hippocampus comes]